MKNKQDISLTLPAIDKLIKQFIQTFVFISIASSPVSRLAFVNSQAGLNLIVLSNTASALPPPEDIPEEILRTEIILEGRSPIDGKPLSAKEYEELKAELAQSSNDPKINSDIRELIFLLQLRKFVKAIIPFY